MLLFSLFQVPDAFLKFSKDEVSDPQKKLKSKMIDKINTQKSHTSIRAMSGKQYRVNRLELNQNARGTLGEYRKLNELKRLC